MSLSHCNAIHSLHKTFDLLVKRFWNFMSLSFIRSLLFCVFFCRYNTPEKKVKSICQSENVPSNEKFSHHISKLMYVFRHFYFLIK